MTVYLQGASQPPSDVVKMLELSDVWTTNVFLRQTTYFNKW